MSAQAELLYRQRHTLAQRYYEVILILRPNVEFQFTAGSGLNSSILQIRD